MRSNIETNIFDKYLEIKQDLVNNLNIIFNRRHTYTHKYRGNLVTDVHVGIENGPNNEKIVKIFVRHKNKWIRDILTLYKDKTHSSVITSNFYNE